MIKEYIKKELETDYGVNAECSVATKLDVNISSGSATVYLDVYPNFATKESHKPRIGQRRVTVSGIDALPIFAVMHDVVISTILTDPQYEGGTLEQVEVPDPEPEPEPPIEP